MIADPIPVPSVVTMTSPERPRAAPYRASASPAASASLTTWTSRPVASVKIASASVSTHDASMLAAEPTTPWRTIAGTVTPDRRVRGGELPEQVGEDGGHGRRGGRLRGVDAHPLGGEVAGTEVDGRSLDARAAEVDAEGMTAHGEHCVT